ncbi:hypothetical protein ACR77M_13105 [Enterococcus avium]|uniref:hypothetical protein n=1 Tax=Enterococcus avium TaxID=33945 RepID=UPI003DA68DD2
MKKCPVCEKHFTSFEDIVEIGDKYFHEECIEIMPVKYCAYIPGDYEDGFLGEFEESNKSWVSNLMDEGEYIKEEQYEIVYLENSGKIRTLKTFGISKDDVTQKVMEFPFVDDVKQVRKVR